MKTMLKKLFDYQSFQKSSRLAAIIADTESRYDGALSDDNLSFVSAAGDVAPAKPSDNNTDDFKEGV